ncbi:MAG TPA: CapA family protein [Actinomycetota bacterium]|nr:CapA family protein [Actinomycetota bacterium]
MRRLVLALVVLAACAGPPADPSNGAPTGGAVRHAPEGTVRLLFAGDVMLGRGVAEFDPTTLLEGVRHVVSSADLAIANLESPLTGRPHLPSAGPNELEATPASAGLLRDAGFDAMGVANNHAGDAGPGTVDDTVAALRSAGIAAIGAGTTGADALSARILTVGGLRIGLLAIDASGGGPRGDGSGALGVAGWADALVRSAVREARRDADVVAVGVHGGLEYVRTPAPGSLRLARLLASWGADVVWGHGPHVIQPVRAVDPDGDGRRTLVATSLGNLLFDQHVPHTRRGALLEVVAGADGVRAFRVGTAEHPDGPVLFRTWRPPRADAVALDGAWWELTRSVEPARIRRPDVPDGFEGDVVDAALGDVDRDGRRDLIVAFRRPLRRTRMSALFPRASLVDALGRSAHVGLYRPGDLRPRWVAGTLLRPVVALAPCDGLLGVAYSTLDRPAVVATGAWRWGGFGFVPLPELSGPGAPACADVDDDGALDPIVLERSPR